MRKVFSRFARATDSVTKSATNSATNTASAELVEARPSALHHTVNRPSTSSGLAVLMAGLGLTLFTTPAFAQDVAITGGKVIIGDGSAPLEGATVIVRGGKVASVTQGGAPAGLPVVDASGKWVTPGIVAGFSRIGLMEVEAVSQVNDMSAPRSPFTAAIDVSPALSPFGIPVPYARSAGITRALVFPGSSSGLFSGQGAVVDLGNDNNMLTRPRAFQYVEFGESGARKAGGSRSATFLTFRAMLQEARDYARNPAAYDGRSKDSLLLRADAEALGQVINGNQRLMVKVNAANDILQVLRLKQDFPAIKMTLVGASEGWRVAREIAAAGTPVIASALRDLPDDFEARGATQSNIGRMRAAGVKVAIGQIDDEETLRMNYTTQYAGNLVALTRVPGASGLSWDQAFATISSGPAEAVGMAGQLGVLKGGAVGDVVIWSGDPLELSSHAEKVFIDGVEQPLQTRQQRLRDRYRNPTEGALPKAYDW